MARPRCLNCGKHLRKAKFDHPSNASPYGDYGDGHFCGLRCGHSWATMYLRRHGAFAAEVHTRIDAIMAQREEQP